MAISPLTEDLVRFSQSTSLHGVSKLTNQKQHVYIRLMWLLVVLLMVCTYLSLLIGTLMDYYSYPTVTNIEYRTITSMPFPSVTLCNYNIAKRSAVTKNSQPKSLPMKTKSNIRDVFTETAIPINLMNADVLKLSKEVSHQPEDMFLECEFEGQYQDPCNVSREVSWTMTPELFCHTFNSAEYISKHGPKISTRPGGKYGLNLLINIEAYEYMIPITNASGIKVLIHDPDVIPDVAEQGFAVAAGSETLAVLKKTVVKRLAEPYSKYPDLCVDTGAWDYKNPLKHFSHYSLSACRRECRIQNQLSECGCSAHIYGGENYTVCPFADFISCSSFASEQYDADPSFEVKCGCQPACEETMYDVSISGAAMPNDQIQDILLEALNVTKLHAGNVKDNLISLKIFFGELRYTMIEQKAVYSSTSLFGELGGQLGLCLGASVFSLAELLQLIVTMCKQFCKSVRKNKIMDSDTDLKSKKSLPEQT